MPRGTSRGHILPPRVAVEACGGRGVVPSGTLRLGDDFRRFKAVHARVIEARLSLGMNQRDERAVLERSMRPLARLTTRRDTVTHFWRMRSINGNFGRMYRRSRNHSLPQ